MRPFRPRQVTQNAAGRLQLLENGRTTEVRGLPGDLHVQGQGGLLDVVPHPQYASNRWIYLTYSKGGPSGTVPALIRGRLDGNELVEVRELFVSNRYAEPGRHYGSRVLFLADGTLLMTLGDRGATPERARRRQATIREASFG